MGFCIIIVGVQGILLLLFLACVTAAPKVIKPTVEPLHFSPNGTFKIALFTDLHYGESIIKDIKSNKMQETILRSEHPDLVVFGGDMVSGWRGSGQPGWFEHHWRQIISPSQSLGIPHALILGNHDDEADLSRRQIIDLDIRGSTMSHTQQGPKYLGGASNYFIDILHHTESINPIASRLWFFDSMDRGCAGMHGWGCISPLTVQWARKCAASLPPVRKAGPSITFVHIPLPQTIAAWRNPHHRGQKLEFSNCQNYDTGLFEKFVKPFNITHVWSGHDHVNDYVGEFDGVTIGYGRKTGYGGYYYSNSPRGARILMLRETGGRGSEGISRTMSRTMNSSCISVETWIATETGEKEYQLPSVSRTIQEQTACASSAIVPFSYLWILTLLVSSVSSLF